MRTNTIVAFVLILLAPCTFAADSYRAVLAHTLQTYIMPSYKRLTENAQQLTHQTSALCHRPTEKQLLQTQSAFYRTVHSWASIEWFRIGPAIKKNRIERFFYFPDRKSRGLKQVQRALLKKNQSVLDVEKLQTMSVALQGLGALDFLLFGKGADDLYTQGSFRCAFAKTISENLHKIATSVYKQWRSNQQLRQYWQVPGQHNPFFRTNKEAMNSIIGTLIHGLESIRDTRIRIFLRSTAEKDRPKSAPLWRSVATIESLVANLQGLELLFNASRIETLVSQAHDSLGDMIRFEFKQAIHTAQHLHAPINLLLSDEQTRGDLVHLQNTVNYLINRLNSEFAPAAGLRTGFSFGDGD